jgi:hypothetical protein
MTNGQTALTLSTDQKESVYYATDMCNIKIGRTRSPKRRGGQLRVDMLLTFEGGELDERRHHRMWQRYRIGTSEWFRATPELLLWLTRQVEPNTYAAAVLDRLIYAVMRGAAA